MGSEMCIRDRVEESVRNYGKHSKLSSMVMFGGVGMQPQIDRLKRGVDILLSLIHI